MQNVFAKTYVEQYLDNYHEIKGGQHWKHMSTVFLNLMRNKANLSVFADFKVVQLLLKAAACEDLNLAGAAIDLAEVLLQDDKAMDIFVKVGIKPFDHIPSGIIDWIAVDWSSSVVVSLVSASA